MTQNQILGVIGVLAIALGIVCIPVYFTALEIQDPTFTEFSNLLIGLEVVLIISFAIFLVIEPGAPPEDQI